MPLGWLDVSDIPFHALCLLERVQMRWLVRPDRYDALAVACQHHPTVAWCLRTKCPEVAATVDELLARDVGAPAAEQVRRCEVEVLDSIQDWLIYVLDPSIYDAQPFLGWDTRELTGLLDFHDSLVLDVGAGTGRLTFAVADAARTVFACEPVGNLRDYLRAKAERLGVGNVYPVDGLITRLPFPAGTFDIVMGGHVFGDAPAAEEAELARVARPGGHVVLCPGNNDKDDERHALLVERGYEWSRFEEPTDGAKRKYWRQVG